MACPTGTPILAAMSGKVTTTMLMGCAVAETTGLYALVIAILLIFVAPRMLVNILLEAMGK